MTAAAQRHRLAAKTQPFNARAPSDPAQKKPDIGNQSLTSNYAKLSLAGEVAPKARVRALSSGGVFVAETPSPQPSPASGGGSTPPSRFAPRPDRAML
ncbi:hypothetical protein ABIA43_000126 [Bradyrhizobium sp. USDA 328]